MDSSVGISAGGRVARAHMHVERQRKITSMMNGIEAKKFYAIKRQIEDDRMAEINVWNRRVKDVLKYSDDMKAFQNALLRKISDVKEKNKTSTGIRPLLNLGRYGGASTTKIRANLDQYRPVRNPTQRRLMRTQQLLQEGKSNGRIKTFKPEVLGDLTQSIMKLDKVTRPTAERQPASVVSNFDPEKLNEKDSEDETDKSSTNSQMILRRRRLVLPPLKVSRSMRPNANYHRRISEESKSLRGGVEGGKRRSALPKIPEEYILANGAYENQLSDEDGEMIRLNEQTTTTSGNRRTFYQWTFLKPQEPDISKNYLTNTQKFWKPKESLTIKQTHIVLPRIT